jgi:carbon-monoxide dehydrogenase medium subunit
VKAAAFALARPGSLAEAAALLAASEDARPLAGGQSLGPMLNLRAARPALLVDLGAIAELHGAEDGADAVTIGARVTHAAIADGRTPDIGQRVLARVAEGIAYRAVRNRGTIGGSLCHADPAADWPCTLTALGAAALTWHPEGGRTVAVDRFVLGAYRTALRSGEILRAVQVPRLSGAARWGYVKACRKPGEFAHAMAAVLHDSARGVCRAAIGALGGAPPLLLEGGAAVWPAARDALAARLAHLDPVDRHIHAAVLRRAFEAAEAA